MNLYILSGWPDHGWESNIVDHRVPWRECAVARQLPSITTLKIMLAFFTASAAEAGTGVTLNLAVAPSREGAILHVQIRGVTSRICVPKNIWSNQRVTLFRNGRPLPRTNDFEARPRAGCVLPNNLGRINGIMRLRYIYPGAKRGDRICYQLPYQIGSQLPPLRQCLTF
jgi:hypothetical protein